MILLDRFHLGHLVHTSVTARRTFGARCTWSCMREATFRPCHCIKVVRLSVLCVPLQEPSVPLTVSQALYSSSARTFRTELKPLPIYASPGHLISLKTALILTLACCIRKESRQPEPILLADRLGRDEAVRLWGR